jgi:hypothetical protein
MSPAAQFLEKHSASNGSPLHRMAAASALEPTDKSFISSSLASFFLKFVVQAPNLRRSIRKSIFKVSRN